MYNGPNAIKSNKCQINHAAVYHYLLFGQNCCAQQKCNPNSSKLLVLGRVFLICWQKMAFFFYSQQFKTVGVGATYEKINVGPSKEKNMEIPSTLLNVEWRSRSVPVGF